LPTQEAGIVVIDNDDDDFAGGEASGETGGDKGIKNIGCIFQYINRRLC
jgi:hypothetical protein